MVQHGEGTHGRGARAQPAPDGLGPRGPVPTQGTHQRPHPRVPSSTATMEAVRWGVLPSTPTVTQRVRSHHREGGTSHVRAAPRGSVPHGSPPALHTSPAGRAAGRPSPGAASCTRPRTRKGREACGRYHKETCESILLSTEDLSSSSTRAIK